MFVLDSHYPASHLEETRSEFQLRTLHVAFVRFIFEFCQPIFIGISKQDSKLHDKMPKRFQGLKVDWNWGVECLSSLSDRRVKQTIKLCHKARNTRIHCTKFSVLWKESRIILTSFLCACFVISSAKLFNEIFKRKLFTFMFF